MIKLKINPIGRPDEPMYDLDWYYDELRDYLESQGNIPEQSYFITKEELRKRDKMFYNFGKESKDYEIASAEVFEEMAIGFAGQELCKAIDKDILEELYKKDK